MRWFPKTKPGFDRAANYYNIRRKSTPWFKIVCLSIFLIINSLKILPAGEKKSFPIFKHDLKFEHITFEDGLPEHFIIWITQDHLGFLWFSSRNGLIKYDGYSFTTYAHEPNNPASISDNTLTEIREDRSGNLWIGTRNGGLNKFNRETETFSHYQHDEKNPTSLSHNAVITIFVDRSDGLWIGTDGGGLNKFDSETETFTHYKHNPADSNSLSDNRIYSICEDKWGNLWIGTGNGLTKLDPTSEEMINYTHDPGNPESLSHNMVSAVYEDRSGTLWVCTNGGGLNIFDPETETFKHCVFEPHPWDIPLDRIFNILEDNKGDFWLHIPMGIGLIKFSPPINPGEKIKFVTYQSRTNDLGSLSGNLVRFIFEDRSGVLWVSTQLTGLNKVDLVKKQFVHLKLSLWDLYSNWILSIIEDNHGTLWIGTNGGGLNKFDRETGKIQSYRNNPENPNSLSNNSVSHVYEDESGTLWVSTLNGGLNKIITGVKNGSQPIFKHYQNDPQNPTSLSHNAVRAVYEDSKRRFWVGTWGGGLDKFDRETETFSHYISNPDKTDGIDHHLITTIFEDSYATLWVGTLGGGLYRYNPESDGFTRYFNHQSGIDVTISIYEDTAGRFWIGTLTGGLHLFDRKTGTSSEIFTLKDGLPNRAIKNILEDETGNLWLGTDRGLSKFNYDNKTFRNYDVDDGLQGNIFTSKAAWKDNKGTMYFGGLNGFNIFHPGDLKDNLIPPPVVLTDIKIFNKSLPPGPDSQLKVHINVAREITLSYWQNDISIDYAALHYSNPAKNKYAYKLENYEDDWRQVGTKHTATYTNLDPGKYIFRVKASNSDGVWNEQGTSINIIIQPPFWATWWFRILVVLSILAIAVTWYNKYINKIEARKRELEIQVAEKTKSAAALQNALSEVQELKNRLQAENVYLRDEIKLEHNFANIISRSDALKNVLGNVEQVAATDATVLILGETGTGKELLARAIHNISNRKDRPLVKVNCAVIPANLIESELFGHEKGAFTGAISRKIGRFELANNGTIFLDEIDDLPLELQSKLLRALQEGEIEHLGNSHTFKVDVRVIAATNRDLEKEVAQGRFRKDLYYRLYVFPITIPPLRERKEDIPLLVKHFVKKFSKKIGRKIENVPQNVIDRLMKYHWPGNVRELENIIERAVITSPDNKLVLGDWFSKINAENGSSPILTLEQNERRHILEALNKTGWRISGEKGVASILGINPKTLESRMKKLGIRRLK